MVYRYQKDGQELIPSCIAHEVLHLYGAWDLYESHSVSSRQAEEAGRWFPNDIMRTTSRALGRLDTS